MRIGITGHQKLGDGQSWRWVEEALLQEIRAATNPLIGVSSLAVGADQRFADLVVGQGGKIQAIIPFEGYERTFSSGDLSEYRRLLAEAESVEILQEAGTDEESYLAAGKKVVELSDLVIAVWNGLPPKGKGGTADIVAHTIQLGRALVHINPKDETVTRILHSPTDMQPGSGL